MRKIKNHYFEKCEKWKVAQLIKILQKMNKLIKKIKKGLPTSVLTQLMVA